MMCAISVTMNLINPYNRSYPKVELSELNQIQ